MKKTCAVIISTLFMVSSVSANLSGFIAEVKTNSLNVGETTYISVFATDDKGSQVDTLTLSSKAADGVTVGKFYNCATAEGRELCGKYDQSFIGLSGGYVASVKATKSGSANISVYSEAGNKGKVTSTSIMVEGEKAEVAAPQDESVATLEVAPKTGAEIKGGKFMMVGLLMLSIIAFLGLRRKEQE